MPTPEGYQEDVHYKAEPIAQTAIEEVPFDDELSAQGGSIHEVPRTPAEELGMIVEELEAATGGVHKASEDRKDGTAELGTGAWYEDSYKKDWNRKTLEVSVTSKVTLEEFERDTPKHVWEALTDLAEKHKGEEWMFINATAAGGGVAIMRSPLIHLMNMLGVNAKWYAIEPDKDKKFFDITKNKFHNVLQDVAEPGTVLTEEDMDLYDEVIDMNVAKLKDRLAEADTIVIDDWQPAGIIDHLKGVNGKEALNPDANLIFRDHIHTNGELMGAEGTTQRNSWSFLWHGRGEGRISHADAFITHPKDEMVPPDVPDDKVVFMGATIDLHDDLNGPTTGEDIEKGFDFINHQLSENEGQTPIDRDRGYFILVARFDESKGMPQALEAYAKYREEMARQGVPESQIKQLLLVGNGSTDDPSGKPQLELMMNLRSNEFAYIKDDVKIARVPHNDRAIQAVLSNADIALQPSIAEGFEARVTDAIFLGVPVIGSDRGGIPLQIIEGLSGHVVDPYNTDRIAEYMTKYGQNELARRMLQKTTEQAFRSHNIKFTTPYNALRFLGINHLLNQQKQGTPFRGRRQSVEEALGRPDLLTA